MPDSSLSPARPSFGQALRAWAYVGLNSFGGPAGQIAVMHRELVERRGWLDERRFLHALSYCMLLPGPEAQQLATYVGWLLHGVRGGLAAGILFILPGVAVLLGLSILYAAFQETALVQALFYGIKPAVVALVVLAVTRLGRRALVDRWAVAIAATAFGAIFFLDLPFPLIVLGAALFGFVRHRRAAVVDGDVSDKPMRPAARRALVVALITLAAWLAPTAVLLLTLGPASIFTQLALFFSATALVTFGGAYAVLAFVAQQAVEGYGWLSPAQMLDGLGMAESTPGPLIMVVQFVGFMAAFGSSSGLDPLVAGVVGGLLVTWVTFAPSFAWIFLGAPYVEQLRGRPALAGALSAITAAVTGVILNLAVWFALQVLFGVTGEVRMGPIRLHSVELASVDLFAVGLALFALLALARLRWPLLPVLALSAAVGAGYYLLAGP